MGGDYSSGMLLPVQKEIYFSVFCRTIRTILFVLAVGFCSGCATVMVASRDADDRRQTVFRLEMAAVMKDGDGNHLLKLSFLEDDHFLESSSQFGLVPVVYLTDSREGNMSTTAHCAERHSLETVPEISHRCQEILFDGTEWNLRCMGTLSLHRSPDVPEPTEYLVYLPLEEVTVMWTSRLRQIVFWGEQVVLFPAAVIFDTVTFPVQLVVIPMMLNQMP